MEEKIQNQELEEIESKDTEEIEDEIQTTETDEEDLKTIAKEIEEADSDEKLQELEDKIKDLTKEEKIVFINDDYIKSQPKHIQKILKPIKGEKLTEKALKNYVNAELYIEKLKKQTQQESKTEPKPEPKPETETNLPQNIPAEIDENKFYELVYLKLKTKYPDLPEYEDKKYAITEYLQNLQVENPVKFAKFNIELTKETEEIENQIREVQDLSKNWENLAMQNINDDIQRFKEKLSQFGLEPDDLGLDLNFTEDFYNDYIYNNILFVDGKANPEVVEYRGKIPIIKKGKVYEKLLSLNFDKIMELRANNSNPTTKKSPPPSLSANSGLGKAQVSKSTKFETLLNLPTYEVSEDDLNKALEELRGKIK